MAKKTAGTDAVQKYISTFPDDVGKLLQKVRQTIQKAAPKAEEAMSYGVPAFKLNGVLVCYASFKKHLGFYPMPSGIKAFAKDLEQYDCAKGTVRFPLDKPLPLKLIRDITVFRVQEQLKEK